MTSGTVIGRALAPAKVNLGLEVLGKRPDGYHEICTIMQTVSLFDRITMISPGTGNVSTDCASIVPAENLVARSANLMASTFVKQLDVDFFVQKRIPVAAGLGGGSSDAATTIRLLASYWRIRLHDPRLPAVAGATGSDVPFFLTGGRALVEGRGEHIRFLPALHPLWVVIVVPDLVIERKTKSLYRALRSEDFSDGAWLRAQAQTAGAPEGALRNAFARPLSEMSAGFPPPIPDSTLPGVAAHGLSGAGPAHFTLVRGLESASKIVWRLRSLEALQGYTVRIARTTPGPGPMTIARNAESG